MDGLNVNGNFTQIPGWRGTVTHSGDFLVVETPRVTLRVRVAAEPVNSRALMGVLNMIPALYTDEVACDARVLAIQESPWLAQIPEYQLLRRIQVFESLEARGRDGHVCRAADRAEL